MSEQKYRVVFQGETIEGQEQVAVKQRLAELFQADLEKIELLFTGGPVTLKTGIDFSTAAKYEATLKKAGARSHIIPLDGGDPVQVFDKPATTEAPENVLEAFSGRIQPVPVPVTYKAGLLLVSIAMVMLPLFYIALIALTAYLVFYHAVENTTVFQGSGAGQLELFIYIAPLVIGTILVLFMIKPIFVGRGHIAKFISLNPQTDSKLFGFVYKICEIVGAPRPKRIDVNCDVNASASFRRGFFSFFGDDLILTLGLPLVAGFNTRQLAGVLAHEFGHFAQGTGMRVTYLIRSINYWFSQVVYHRDRWDERLESWSRNIDIRIGFILYVARFFVWMTRKILWCFMMLGHTFSCFMLRQMEFDADRYEAQLVGSKQFDVTSMRLRILATAAQVAHDDLATAWDEHRLANDLPDLIFRSVDQLPPEIETNFQQEIEQGETHFFDTHPADKKRIVNAMKQNASGVFRLELPATALFTDFRSVSQRATDIYYRDELGLPVRSEQLISNEELEQRKKALQATYDALASFTAGAFNARHPLPIRIEEFPATPAADGGLVDLKANRKQLKNVRVESLAQQERLNKVEDRIFSVFEAKALVDAGFKINASDFSLASGSPEVVERALSKAITEKAALLNNLQATETLIAQRFQQVYALIGSQHTYSITHPQRLRLEMEDLIRAYAPLSAAVNGLFDLQENTISLFALLNNYDGNEENEQLVSEIQRYHKECVNELDIIQRALQNTPYLFDHGKGDISMASYVFGGDWDKDDIGLTVQMCETALEKVTTLHVRLVGRLAEIAITVEEAVSLTPLDLDESQGKQ